MNNELQKEKSQMTDVIASIRTDRRREINAKIEKGIIIKSVRTYRYVDKIIIRLNDGEVPFGIQADEDEIYFYIGCDDIRKNASLANMYFSIEDIYNVLNSLSEEKKKRVRLLLLELTKEIDFKNVAENHYRVDEVIYCGLAYKVTLSEFPDDDWAIACDDGAGQIGIKKVMLLIYLIQEKSNVMLNQENSHYRNGIVRLLIAILSRASDHKILKEKGWRYNETINCFQFIKEGTNRSFVEKYCLTSQEYDTIIDEES